MYGSYACVRAGLSSSRRHGPLRRPSADDARIGTGARAVSLKQTTTKPNDNQANKYNDNTETISKKT